MSQFLGANLNATLPFASLFVPSFWYFEPLVQNFESEVDSFLWSFIRLLVWTARFRVLTFRSLFCDPIGC